MQVYRIVLLPHDVVGKADSGDGGDEDPGMYLSVLLECVVHEPGGVYADDHVCDGSDAVFLGQVFVVYHCGTRCLVLRGCSRLGF
jgi:hypothetical protein